MKLEEFNVFKATLEAAVADGLQVYADGVQCNLESGEDFVGLTEVRQDGLEGREQEDIIYISTRICGSFSVEYTFGDGKAVKAVRVSGVGNDAGRKPCITFAHVSPAFVPLVRDGDDDTSDEVPAEFTCPVCGCHSMEEVQSLGDVVSPMVGATVDEYGCVDVELGEADYSMAEVVDCHWRCSECHCHVFDENFKPAGGKENGRG